MSTCAYVLELAHCGGFNMSRTSHPKTFFCHVAVSLSLIHSVPTSRMLQIPPFLINMILEIPCTGMIQIDTVSRKSYDQRRMIYIILDLISETHWVTIQECRLEVATQVCTWQGLTKVTLRTCRRLAAG